MTDFLERLKQSARFAGVGETQTEIALSLGLNRQTVNRWFHGSEPSVEQTFNIAKRFGVDPHWLSTGGGEMRPSADGLSPEERELLKNYRSATAQVRHVIRTMARAVRKSIVALPLVIPPLLAPSPIEAYAGVYYVKSRIRALLLLSQSLTASSKLSPV